MWWSGLPGLDSQAASSRALADRATAIACADRIRQLDPTYGGAGTPTGRLAQELLDWLTGEPEDSRAQARRLALCITCTHATADSTLSDILRTAKWLYQHLTA